MQINLCVNCMAETTGYPCPHCGFDANAQPQPEYALPWNTILHGKYLVGRMLGQGGFGITYVGFDLTLEVKVAIKEFYPSGQVSRQCTLGHDLMWNSTQQSVASRNAGMDSFLKEARKMARVDQIPLVVRVRDTFRENGTAYIIMDFVEGETLKARLEREGPLPFRQAMDIFRPAMEAMEEVHKAGLIHRDLSPDNLMLKPDGSVSILDLGAAKDLAANHGASSMLVTKGGFSPLEQYGQRGGAGPWTDVYAMAATLYYTLTGVLPPNAIDRLDDDTLRWDLPGLQAMGEPARKALQKALAVNARDRTQTMSELLQELDWQAPPVPPGPHPNPKKKRWIAALCAAAAVIAVWVAMVSANSGPTPPVSPSPAETELSAPPTSRSPAKTETSAPPASPSPSETEPSAPSEEPTSTPADRQPDPQNTGTTGFTPFRNIDHLQRQLPDYALSFYRWLEEAADNDGVNDYLIEDKYFAAGTAADLWGDDPELYDIVHKDDGAYWFVARIEGETDLHDACNELRNAFDLFLIDHPEVFWLCGDGDLVFIDSRMTVTSAETETVTHRIFLRLNDTNDPSVDVRVGYTQSTIRDGISGMNASVNKILTGMPESGAAQKVRYFNQWLTAHNDYCTDDPAPKVSNRSISALMGSTGAEGPGLLGYSLALKVLCDRADVTCFVITGSTGQGFLAFNYVQVDGAWYAVDVTWNDPVVVDQNGNRIVKAVSGYEKEEYLLVGKNTTNSDGESFEKSHNLEVEYPLKDVVLSSEAYMWK